MKIEFTFGENFHITPYSICIIAGTLISILVIFLLAGKKGLDHKELFWSGVSAATGAFLGAHILYFLTVLPSFISSLRSCPPVDVGDFFYKMLIASSGLVYYGGLFGAMAAICIFTRKRRINGRGYMNIFVVVFPLFHFAGRIGCALTGCCYGIEYHGPFAIQYTSRVITEGVNDHIADFPRFPVQPLEALCELILFMILLMLWFKKEDSVSLIPYYLLPYAVIRFADEFLRGDDIRGFWGIFSTSQWIALAVIAVTVIYLIRKKTKPLKTK